MYDLKLLSAYLRQVFPDSSLKLGQIREHLVVEGQARSQQESTQIVQTIQSFLASVQVPFTVTNTASAPDDPQPQQRPTSPSRDSDGEEGDGGSRDAPGDSEDPGRALPEREKPNTTANFAAPQIINLIRVPGVCNK